MYALHEASKNGLVTAPDVQHELTFVNTTYTTPHKSTVKKYLDELADHNLIQRTYMRRRGRWEAWYKTPEPNGPPINNKPKPR